MLFIAGMGIEFWTSPLTLRVDHGQLLTLIQRDQSIQKHVFVEECTSSAPCTGLFAHYSVLIAISHFYPLLFLPVDRREQSSPKKIVHAQAPTKPRHLHYFEKSAVIGLSKSRR